MWAKHKQQSGFTIVELLIVIVVIGILAAITIVAYNGIQDRARMSAALSFSSQISRSPDILDAIVFYTFDQDSGTTIKDKSEKANDGSANTATFSSDTPTGSGKSFQFNGSNRIATTLPIQPSYYYKSAWIKPTGCNNIISAASGTSDAFYLPSCKLSSGHNANWTQISDSVALNDGKWHHVALEFKQTNSTAGTMKLWRDGVLVKTEEAPLPGGIAATTPMIGAFGTGNFYAGLMDDVIVITR